MTEEHQRVMGICYPNKCYVEVPTKEEYDEKVVKVDEHEERLANITKEVDGDLSCKTVITSGNITSGGTITSTGKINANGGLAVTSLTASGTITATGIINANGGLKMTGDFSAGKIAGTTGTFSGAVTGTSFNGVVLKSSGTITVTPIDNTNLIYIPYNSNNLTLLPPNGQVKYSGSIKFNVTGTNTIKAFTGANASETISITSSKTTLTFSNIPYLVVSAGAGTYGYYPFKLS